MSQESTLVKNLKKMMKQHFPNEESLMAAEAITAKSKEDKRTGSKKPEKDKIP